MFPNPWLIVASLVLLIASHSWAFYKGGEVRQDQIDAEQLTLTIKAIEHAEEQAVDDNKLVEAEIVIQEKIKIVYREIKVKANENIDKNPVYAECGLDADGVRLFNGYPRADTPSTAITAH